jgi:hypothetical protein
MNIESSSILNLRKGHTILPEVEDTQLQPVSVASKDMSVLILRQR